MNTTRTTRFAGLIVAVLMTVATNGAVLWTFDNVAQEATLAHSAQAPTLVTLNTVTVVARHS